jgi:hypothetical protein
MLAMVGLVSIGAVGVVARQSVLARTGVTVNDLQAWATRMVVESTASDGVWVVDVTPAVSATGLKAIHAMTPSEKLALTQEVMVAVKATVMSPAFRAAHTARIAKQVNRAVDHGVDAVTFGAPGAGEADTLLVTLLPVLQMMQGFSPEVLQNALEEDRTQAAETIKEETGPERAKAQKYLARLNELVPLTKSNPEEFKRQYIVAKSAFLGGPDTEAKLRAATASADDRARIRNEQTYWNKYNLNAILRKNLTNVIEQAGRVDFKAATHIEYFGAQTNMYFSGGGLMSSLEQFERHVGPAATAAAIQFAKAWLKEVQ